jgi:type VI secretion system secreted protein Hcp
MAFDAYLYFTQAASSGNCPQPKGESLIQKDAISLGEGWSFSMENKLDISSVTTGAGAGKAEFLEFTIKKQVDSATPVLMLACGCGANFDNVQLVLRKATGATNAGTTEIFLKFTYMMMVVEKMEWAYGEPAPEETVTFKFGAMQVDYFQQDAKGNLKAVPPQMWSQVKASNVLSVA